MKGQGRVPSEGYLTVMAAAGLLRIWTGYAKLLEYTRERHTGGMDGQRRDRLTGAVQTDRVVMSRLAAMGTMTGQENRKLALSASRNLRLLAHPEGDVIYPTRTEPDG